MNTTYEYIFSEFKDGITDPDLITFAEELQSEMLVSLLNKAVTKCQRIVKKVVDLTQRDDVDMAFLVEVPDEVVDILVEWMTVYWLKPYVNNLENLRNGLNTKDFSIYSPANLLEKIGARYDKSKKDAKSMTNEYSYVIADMTRLKT